ncbi:MAG: hypothetical protein PHW13_11725 [Methylococcales bacterium]|nr:hypothetical protein [Methylococcales bacterium]
MILLSVIVATFEAEVLERYNAKGPTKSGAIGLNAQHALASLDLQKDIFLY